MIGARSPLDSEDRSRRRVVFAVLLAVVLAALPCAPEEGEKASQLDGKPIVAIRCERFNIFDTSDRKTSSWPYRWANALHVRTRERLIRSVLLFTEGDPYSSDAAAESERLLRGLGIMNPVDITAREVEGGVEVIVETHDQWSLQVGADAGLSGNRGDFGFQLQEENLAGWGKYLNLGYDSDVERDTWSIRYQDPAVFLSRWIAEVGYQSRSDGFFKDLRIARPFFALETRRAWDGWWKSEEIVEHLYSANESVIQGRRRSESFLGWYGFRLRGGASAARRLMVGWDFRRDRFDEWQWTDSGTPYAAPADLDVSGPRIEVEKVHNSFEVLTGFRSWSSQEDIGLGPNYRFGLTLSGPVAGGDISRLLFDGVFSIARHRGRWLVMGDAHLSGRFDRSDPADVLAGFQLGAAQIGSRGFQLRLLVEASHNLDADRQLTLGADVGLRGWDPDTFDGTGRALVNAQWRTLLARDVIQLFSVGAVVFVDAGMTWGARVGADTDGIRSDAGLGLLFDLSRFSTNNVLRVEIAWPDDGGPYVVTVSGGALF